MAGHALVVGGDWNCEPPENPFEGVCRVGAVCDDAGLALPTRWSGQRCIDYFVMHDSSSDQSFAWRTEFLGRATPSISSTGIVPQYGVNRALMCLHCSFAGRITGGIY